MPRRALGVARAFLLAATAFLLVTCTDSNSPRLTEGPSFAISDGASGGNVDVFFLPPLASSPHGSDYGDRPANPSLHPMAEICTLNATESVPAPSGGLACTTAPDDIASLPMTYDATGEFYGVNWKTSDTPLDTNSMYRVAIFVGRVPLAFRDVDPDPGPPRGACRTSDDFCQFQNGSNVAIKVRIETDAVCLALDPGFDTTQPCATASLDAGGSLSLSDLGIAQVDDPATISMMPCGDLRDRGIVDLRTYGECVQIDDVDYIPGVTLGVTGTATLCHALDAATAAGLSDEQIDRMTIHRFGIGDDPPLVALPHTGGGGDCSTLTPTVGLAPEPKGLDRLYRLARRTWSVATSQVHAWIEATPLWASAIVCNYTTSGCGSPSGFESDFQAILPSWGLPDVSNPGGDLGTHDVGDVVLGRVKVLDSGELPSPQSPLPSPVNDVRLTVTATGGTVSAVTTCSDPRPGQINICSGADGIATFALTMGPGINTVTISGIGFGTDDGDGDPVNNVFAPSFNAGETASPVALGVGTVTFTATGIVPLVFVPDPPSGSSAIYTDPSTGIATMPDFQVCADPRTEGVAITSLDLVTNNGTYKDLGNLPSFPVVTGTDGCFTFSGTTIDGTGAFRAVANGIYRSLKFNVKPGK